MPRGSSLWKKTKRKTKPGPTRVILGLFDVLGFESQFAKNGLKEMARKYRLLISSAKRAAEQPDVIRAMMPDELPFTFDPGPGCGFMAVLIAANEINHAYFSDTILLWSEYHRDHVEPFFNACINMFQKSLEIGLPLRGAISIGDVIFHREKGIFLGSALIEAARLEKDQRWIGVTLSGTFLVTPPFNRLYPHHTIPYSAHFKDPDDRKRLALALDWPRAFREQKIADFPKKVSALDIDPRFSAYYANTLAFIKHSKKYANWGKSRNSYKDYMSQYPYV